MHALLHYTAIVQVQILILTIVNSCSSDVSFESTNSMEDGGICRAMDGILLDVGEDSFLADQSSFLI